MLPIAILGDELFSYGGGGQTSTMGGRTRVSSSRSFVISGGIGTGGVHGYAGSGAPASIMILGPAHTPSPEEQRLVLKIFS